MPQPILARFPGAVATSMIPAVSAASAICWCSTPRSSVFCGGQSGSASSAAFAFAAFRSAFAVCAASAAVWPGSTGVLAARLSVTAAAVPFSLGALLLRSSGAMLPLPLPLPLADGCRCGTDGQYYARVNRGCNS